MIFYTQPNAIDYDPTYLRMVAAYHSKHYSLPSLREKSHITRKGVSLLGINDAAEAIGFRTMGVKVSFDKLKKTGIICPNNHITQNHKIYTKKKQKY